MRPRALLLSLPDELMEQIVLLFPAKERARTFSLLCRRLRDMCKTSCTLWSHLSVGGLGLRTQALALSWCNLRAVPKYFRRWTCAQVVLPRAASVRHLDLRGPDELSSQLPRLWALVRVALAAVAPTLVSLRLVWPGTLKLEGPWLGQLKRLQLVWVEAEFIDVASTQMAGLPSLRSIELRAWRLRLTQDNPVDGPQGTLLPAGLRRVGLSAHGLQAPPACLPSLSSLVSLSLEASGFREVSSMQCLSNLTTLQELQLSGLREMPRGLGLLTNLRVLYVDSSFRKRPPPDESGWQAVLGGLGCLAVLSLRESRLRGKLPEAVAAMTTLRCLLLNSRYELQLCPGPYLDGLEVLSLGWRTLLDDHQQLSACTRLSKLYLGSCGHRAPFLGDQQGAVGDPAFLGDESESDEDLDEELGWDVAWEAEPAGDGEAAVEGADGGAAADGAGQQEGVAAEGGAGVAAVGAAGPEVQQGAQGPAEPALAQEPEPPAEEEEEEEEEEGLGHQPHQQQQGDVALGSCVGSAGIGLAAEAAPAEESSEESFDPEDPLTQLEVFMHENSELLESAFCWMEELGVAVKIDDPGKQRRELWEDRVFKILQLFRDAVDVMMGAARWIQQNEEAEQQEQELQGRTLAAMSGLASRLSKILLWVYECLDLVAPGWREIPATAGTAPWLGELVAVLGQGSSSSELLQLAAVSMADGQAEDASAFGSLSGLHKLMLEAAVKNDQMRLALQTLGAGDEGAGPAPWQGGQQQQQPEQQQHEPQQEGLGLPEEDWYDSTGEPQQHGGGGESLGDWAAAGFSDVPPGAWGDGSLGRPDQGPYDGFPEPLRRNARQALVALSSLPTLRHVVHLFTDGRAAMNHVNARLLYALPLRCPWLRVSVLDSSQFGWRLADVLRHGRS